MARKSQWTNEEMWEEAVRWRKGGLTYDDICAELARNEERFGLRDIPSEDTVRREVTRRLDKGGRSPTTTHGAGTDIHTQDIRSSLQEWLKRTKWPLPSPGMVPLSAWQEQLNRPLSLAGTPLFEVLRKGMHLPSDLWDTFNELEDEIRALLQDAEKLMRDIGEIAEKATGLKVVDTLQTERVRPSLYYRLAQPCLMAEFASSIYWLAFTKGDFSELEYLIKPILQANGKPPIIIASSAAIEVSLLVAAKESPPLFELCVAPGGGVPFGTIALGQEDQVELCRQKHRELVRAYQTSPPVETMRRKWSSVDKQREALAQMLAKERLMPKFPGGCELCSPG